MSKVYHSRIPNSTFIVQPTGSDGKPAQGQTTVLQFKGDTLTVDDPVHITALDQVADTPGCPIYTKSMKAAMQDVNIPFQEVKARAAEVVEQIAKAGQRA